MKTRRASPGQNASAIEVATAAMKQNDTTMSVVAWATGIAVAIITIITAGGVGTVLYGQHGVLAEANKKLEEATASSGRIREIEKSVREMAERIVEFDNMIRSALLDTNRYSESLPKVESIGVLGNPPEIPPADTAMQMEEADILTVVGEKFSPPQEARSARARVSFARALLAPDRELRARDCAIPQGRSIESRGLGSLRGLGSIVHRTIVSFRNRG
jgi:hypothetical protein